MKFWWTKDIEDTDQENHCDLFNVLDLCSCVVVCERQLVGRRSMLPAMHRCSQLPIMGRALTTVALKSEKYDFWPIGAPKSLNRFCRKPNTVTTFRVPPRISKLNTIWHRGWSGRTSKMTQSGCFFCRVMLCIRAANAVMRCPSVHLSVCLSVTFVDSVETNKHIF